MYSTCTCACTVHVQLYSDRTLGCTSVQSLPLDDQQILPGGPDRSGAALRRRPSRARARARARRRRHVGYEDTEGTHGTWNPGRAPGLMGLSAMPTRLMHSRATLRRRHCTNDNGIIKKDYVLILCGEIAAFFSGEAEILARSCVHERFAFRKLAVPCLRSGSFAACG